VTEVNSLDRPAGAAGADPLRPSKMARRMFARRRP
jgi:hypothetical protein